MGEANFYYFTCLNASFPKSKKSQRPWEILFYRDKYMKMFVSSSSAIMLVILLGLSLFSVSRAFHFAQHHGMTQQPTADRSIHCAKPPKQPSCWDADEWRSFDGTCNNRAHPLWGAKSTPLRRLEASRYENHIDAPVGWNSHRLYSGFPLPSARDISVGVLKAKSISLSDSANQLLMAFGQYFSHDVDITPNLKKESAKFAKFPNGDCKNDCKQVYPCFPIPIDVKDQRRRTGQRCVEFVRSRPMCESSSSLKWRQQEPAPMEFPNMVTSFLDASAVYGSDEKKARSLRLFGTGKLNVSAHRNLPFAADSNGCKPLPGKEVRRDVDIPCFHAGDVRANEHLALTSIHTIFMREHNRIVDQLSVVNPHWDGERLYQEARKINYAIHQRIVYDEYLPKILGPRGMRQLGAYSRYNPRLNPSVTTEMSTAAFRFGHGQIHPIVFRYEKNYYSAIPQGHLEIRKSFFAPYRIVEEGGIDPIVRGLLRAPGKKMDNASPLADAVVEELWVMTEKFALDLGAPNIQRGRDHGLRSYLDYRRHCGLSAPTTWRSLKFVLRPDIVTKLEELYGNPENIDMWVGGMLEQSIPGAVVGPTFSCILIEGFQHLRDGDRFWYERPQVMNRAQRDEIKKTSLARVICDNADDIDEIPEDAFRAVPRGLTSCQRIPGINFEAWRESLPFWSSL